MKKIIVLEDQEVLGEIYKKNLEKAGYEVVWLQTTEETERAAGEFSADLILLDHGICGGDKTGLDLIPYLKKLQPNAKIVMLSNYSHFQLEKDALEAGAECYLVKINTPPPVLVDFVKKLFKPN